MELQSLEKYNKTATSLQANQGALKAERDKLQRQLAYFQDQLEMAKTIESKEDITKCESGITIVSGKLKEVETQLDQGILVTLAQGVIDEAEQEIGKLHNQIQDQWEIIIKARVQYLEELKQLGKLRKETQAICWQTHGVSQALRRNPLPMPGVNGQHQFVVDLQHINQLIEANL